MLDGVSLDQLRIFIAAADHGSFSAAARRLRRTQSAISEAVANLERQLGVALFDRRGRYPTPTRDGAVLLADARTVVGGVDTLKSRAKGIAGGVEAELSVVVDVFFPIDTIAEAARGLRMKYPMTTLRLRVEALGAALEPLLAERCDLAIVGPAPVLPGTVIAEPLIDVPVVMVAAAGHPLADHAGPIPQKELDKHVQLVLTDRSALSAGRDFDVRSPTTWRLADLFAKHAFLLNSLGWGGMPLHTVAADIAAGRLVRLDVASSTGGDISLSMQAVYRTADPPGSAGRWFISRLTANQGVDD